jgi:hypothetical protein
MSSNVQWEYRIEVIGSVWRSLKPEETQAYLNDLGAQGWEIINLHHPHNSNKAWITAKRPISETDRRRQNRRRDWDYSYGNG